MYTLTSLIPYLLSACLLMLLSFSFSVSYEWRDPLNKGETFTAERELAEIDLGNQLIDFVIRPDYLQNNVYNEVRWS